MKYSVFFKAPTGFEAYTEAAGCYFDCAGKILLLKRHVSRPQGETWGVPAGKLEPGETARQAVIREVFEEIGVDISDGVAEIGKLYVQLPHIGYIFHMFYRQLSSEPELSLGLAEHTEARWVTLKDALDLPLIAGGKEALAFYQSYLAKLF